MMRPDGNNTRRPLRYAQRGASIWLILVMGILLVIVGGTALKAAPTYIEYLSIKKAAETAGKESSVAQVRRAFDRTAQIDNISSINSKDLTIEPGADGGHEVSFQYEKEVPLAGPVKLVIDYAGGQGAAE